MKKTLVLLLLLSLFTACNAEEKSSETAKFNETTEAMTDVTADNNVIDFNEAQSCEAPTEKLFYSVEDFESYMHSGKMTEDFAGTFYTDGTPVTYDHIKPYIPVFDENKYELRQIRLWNINYEYWFRNLETDESFSVTIDFDTYFHTFEEMAENMSVKLEYEQDRVINIWDNTPAIIQAVTYIRDKFEYGVYAMLDENNKMIFEGITNPEELKATVEEIPFRLSDASTEASVENETQPLVFYDFSQMKTFDTVEEFETYLNTDQKEKDFPHIFSEKSRDIFGDVTLLKPVFDETKYEFRGITFVGTSYNYSFRNITTDKFFDAAIEYNTYYHTFEEMVEAANANLVVDVEKNQTTVWGDTPALIQSVPFSAGYSIRAMIDENSSVYMSGDGMTPEELTSTLNDITFE